MKPKKITDTQRLDFLLGYVRTHWSGRAVPIRQGLELRFFFKRTALRQAIDAAIQARARKPARSKDSPEGAKAKGVW